MRRLIRRTSLTVLAFCAAAVVAAMKLAGHPEAVFIITHGGTYRGSYSSDDPRVAVIAVNTAEPVVIENSTLRGSGHLITSHYHRANVTIRNTRGIGVNPNRKGVAVGRFASIEGFDNVTIENCEMESTGGVYLLDYKGDGSDRNTVKILRDRAKNIDGRKSDGNGGYLDDVELVQFAQLDKVRHVPGVEIAWNEVVNEPGKSAVEDVINIYLSSGTKESPIRIHDNFIRGAYPRHPERDEYAGGGILLGDGKVSGSADLDAAFVVAEDNQVLDTTNHGTAIAAGHDCVIRRNRIVSAGVLPDGREIAAQNVGAYIWDSYGAGKGHFFSNGGGENVIGWIKGDGRNDDWTPDAAKWEGNEPWSGPITPAVYDEEWRRWQKKLEAAAISVGVK